MKYLFFLLLFSFPQYVFSMHIVIDPGHGGTDQGAKYHQMTEAALNLQIAKKLFKLLQQDPNFEVNLTRSDNNYLNLEQRAKIAKDLKGDLFISIHSNASPSKQAKGAEFYFQNQMPLNQESMFLANHEIEQMKSKGKILWPLKPIPQAHTASTEVKTILQDLQRNYRIKLSSHLSKYLAKNWGGLPRAKKNRIKQAPFYLLENVNMPSALVEVGFLTNLKEVNLLKQANYQHKIALGIYKGLIKYKEFIDKEPSNSLH